MSIQKFFSLLQGKEEQFQGHCGYYYFVPTEGSGVKIHIVGNKVIGYVFDGREMGGSYEKISAKELEQIIKE